MAGGQLQALTATSAWHSGLDHSSTDSVSTVRTAQVETKSQVAGRDYQSAKPGHAPSMAAGYATVKFASDQRLAALVDAAPLQSTPAHTNEESPVDRYRLVDQQLPLGVSLVRLGNRRHKRLHRRIQAQSCVSSTPATFAQIYFRQSPICAPKATNTRLSITETIGGLRSHCQQCALPVPVVNGPTSAGTAFETWREARRSFHKDTV